MGYKKVNINHTVVDLLFVVDFLIGNVEVDQSITRVDQHVSDILVDQVVSHFLGFSQCHEANFAFGVLGQILKFDLTHELGEVFVLGEGLLYLLFF